MCAWAANEESMIQMNRGATFEDVLRLVRELSPVEKLRLIERVAPDIERELIIGRRRPGVSQLGIFKDLGPAPSSDDIDASRREAWINFPREDA
jgi:hypothetical protein